MPKTDKIQHKVVQKKKPAGEKKKATSEQDWQDQENAEAGPIERSTDYINDAVGRTMYITNASLAGWRTQHSRGPLFVTRFYMHAPQVIIDKPVTHAELDDKAAFFKNTDIAYVALAPDESITPTQLRQRIHQALAEAAKRILQPVAKAAPAAAPAAAKAAPKAAVKPKPKKKKRS